MVKAALNQAEPFTRIYIDAHGQPDDDYLTQFIYSPEEPSGKFPVKVTAEQMADLLARAVPSYAQNNLQIKLLACHPGTFARHLMKKLHQHGFKRTSVISYDEVSIEIGGKKLSKNQFALRDFTTESRDCGYSLTPKRGKHLEDIKTAFHNYDGIVSSLPSRAFKAQYLTDFSCDSGGDIGNLTLAQSEVVLLKNKLMQSLNGYIDSYKERVAHCFGTLVADSYGFRKAETFVEQILLIDTKSIIDHSDQTERFIQQMLRELKNFVNQTGRYSAFKSCLHQAQVSTDDDSAVTCILRAIGEFYVLQGEAIQSEQLKKFSSQLIGSDNLETQAARLFFEFKTKENRDQALAQTQSFEL
ncbi:hypothetical protein [Piscirickettsia salmonis]|uniref:hypothetical protein n=1 Tax=Piscirickettsia salmonis TaxID=1238 RepID=UPI0007C949F1|nr:hypothetical protein A0O36_02364 [Piscirickettsiaceae bacterium NZ-RLO1]